MPVIPFQSASRIAQDAQAAADLREAQDAEEARRYREAADAKLKELRATGVKKFDATAGKPMINVPDRLPAGGARLNAPGIETPDMREPGGYFSDSYQPEEGDALWNQYESDRTGPNNDMGYVALPGQSRNGVGGPQQDISDPVLEAIAQREIARQKERAGAADEAMNRTRALNAPNPDQAAQAQELAGKTGANRLEVLNNLDTYQRADLADRLDGLQRLAPKLRTWLDFDPQNFEVAHDDVENLGWWEQLQQSFARTDELKAQRGRRDGAGLGALTDYPLGDNFSPGVANVAGVVEGGKAIGQSLAAGYATTSSGVAGLLRSPLEINDQFASWVAGRKIESGASQYMTRLQTAAQSAAADWRYKSDDPTIQGLLSGVESLPTSAFVIAATMVTGGTAAPLFGAATGGALTAGDKYGEMRSQGASALDSTGVALAHGILETAFEIPELKWLVGDLEHGVPFLQMMYKQAAVQVVTENGASLTQDFVDWAFLPENKGKPFQEYLDGRVMAAYQTTLAALVGTGIQTTGAKALDSAMLKIDEGYQQKRAEAIAKFISGMGDNAKASKLLKRGEIGADKYREVVAAAVKDTPRENVRINPEGIAELAQSQGVTPEQLAQAFRIDPETMVQAMDTGDDIIVPSGNFAAVIQTAKKDIGVSGETIYQALAPHIRLNANDFTARESEAFQKVAKAEADARAEWNATENDFAASSETVETDIRDQIRATGRFNEDTVDGQAKLMGQLVNVIAKQTGQDPADVWKNDGFNIMSAVTGEQTEGAVLPQGAELPADATPTQRLIDMRAKGSSNAEIATALYPDVEPKTAVNRVKALASKNKAKIEERKAQLEGAATQPAADPANATPSSDLASGGNTPNATIALGRTRALIKMFEGANLSSLAHEGAHWYLDLLFRMSKSENPHPFVQAQMARILEFAGKSQEWDGMFDATGNFTEEGRKLQEQFAEAFEVHLMTGKAPSVGMRSVLNTFKQWLLGVYKAYRKGIDQSVRDVGPYTRARIDAYEKATGKKLTGQALFDFVVPQELRDVFDRMLATEDAINAAQTNMVRDSEAMAKAMLEKLDPEGKWKPERQQKFIDRMRERYAEAKERAEAALMARLMDEYTRARSTVAREEERDIRQEVASEIDEQPAQRVYQVLSGQGWRDTRADHAEAQADAAEVMATLAQMVSTEQRQAWQLERGAVDDTVYFFGTYSAGALGDIENYDLSKAGSQSGSGERAMFLTTSSRRANTYADPGMSSADQYFTREEDPARWEKVRTFLGGASVSDAAVRGYISRSVDTPGVFKAYVRGPVRDVDWAEYTGNVTFDDEAMKRLIDEEMARPEGPRNLRITNIADGGNDRTAINMVVLDPDNVMNAISSSRADDAGSSLAQGGQASSVKVDGDSPMRVSTRQPWSPKSTENALTGNLQIGLASTLADPGFADKIAGAVRGYVNFPVVDGETTAQTLERYTQHVVDNLLWLHDSYDAETRDRADEWYNGARAITDAWMVRYDVPDFVIAGVIAAMSPQKDWFQNVSFGERVLDAYVNQRNADWTPEMQITADRIFPRVKTDKKTGEPLLNKKGVVQGYAALRDLLDGKTIAQLEAEFADDDGVDQLIGAWIRVYDQTYNEPGYRIITPEGRFADYAVNQDGVTRSSIQWGSLVEIGKAVFLIRNPDLAAASEALGTQHKVRNFYNNILAPDAPHGDVTIDTHAVAAAHIRPHSAASPEVDQNLNGPPTSAITGSIGTYGLHAEAYRRAANQRGILPRQMQSITWEAVRTLFKPRFKNAANSAKVDKIWQEHRDGKITAEEARNRVSDIAGGIEPPAWVGTRSAGGLAAADGYSTYEGSVPRSRLPGGSAGGVGRGTRGAAATGNTTASRSLAQSQTHDPAGERELDALGFYSSVQEAAKSVPDGIWQLGWPAARNALAKGRGTTRPTFEELDQLGIDDAVAQAEIEAGQPLKGAELAALVADIIDANRIMMERADAIFDPAKARAEIRQMNKQQIWGELSADSRSWMAMSLAKQRIEQGTHSYTLDTSEDDAIVLEFKEGDLTYAYSGNPIRISSVDIPVYRRHAPGLKPTLVETITIRTAYGGLDPDKFAEKRAVLADIKYHLRDRVGQIFAELGEDTIIRKTLREDMVDSLPLVEKGSLGDRPLRHDPGDYDVDSEAKYGEIRMMLPVRFHDALTGSTHSGEPGEVINILWSVRKDAEGRKSLFLRQLQSDEGQQLRLEKQAILDRREQDVAMLMKAGYSRVEAEEEIDSDIEALSRVPLMARTSLWVNAGVRALVFEAAKKGMTSVSIPTAQTSTIIQGNADAALHYETNVKGALEKIARQLNAEVSLSTVQADGYPDGVPVYTMQITPEMRRKIVSEGFPLFQTRTGKDRIAQPASIPAMRLNLDAVREQYGEEAVAALPPAVRAYSTEATDADDFVTQAKAVRQTLNKKHPKSLWKFLSTPRRIGEGNDKISYRGIRDDGGEILKIIGAKKEGPGLIADQEDSKRARSYTIEHAAEVAWAEGYFSTESPPTPQEFLDALRADFDGQAKLYARNDMPLVDEIRNAEQWAAWFDENGIDITEKDQAVLKAQIETKLSGTSENAIGPDEAAPFFGMPDGKALLEGLKQGPLRDKLIREETKRRMIERHGDTFSDGTMINEAMAYARNEIQHRQFEIELEALADAAGQRAQANLAKQTAIDNLRSKQVREVLNYNQWLTLSERWGKKAVEAAAKGDMAKAMEFARYRLINSMMYTEGKKLAEKIEKTRTHLLDYGKKTKQARLFAAGAEYQANMNGLLSDYQFRNESKKGESQRAARGAWIKAQMAGIDPYAAYQDNTKSDAEKQADAAEQLEKSQLLATLGEGADAKGYKSLTVEEMLAVRDEADLIWKLATLKDRLLKEGERRRLSLAAQDVAAEIEANQPNEKTPEPIETDAPGYKLKRGGLKYFAMHRTLQSLARQFAGGKDGGKFWNYIVRPLNEAFARLSTIRHQMGKDVGDLFSAYTEDEKRRMFRDRQTFNFTQSGGPRITLSKQGRLAFALNWGNDKNRRRLMDSLGLDAAMVGQVLDTLDKRDWDFVQKTWDYLDTWFPEANRVHEAVHGAPMDKEDPLKVATRFGIYSGGYYPIKFDPMLSSKTGQRQVMADSKAMTGQVGQRNAPGFTKARNKGKVTLPLRLSVLDVITGHLDQVATSIATEEAFFDAGRIIKQAEVENAIVTRHGREVYNTIVNMLVTAKFGLEGASGVLAHLRNGATVVGLGWKVGTALLQPLGISNSIVRVGGFWIAKGYAMMGHDAVTVRRRATWATERSEFMRNRREANSPEMAALRKDLKASVIDLPIRIPGLRLTKKGMDAIKDNAFAMMANVQFYSVDVPTWYGALLKAQAAGMNEADAIAEADQAVIDAQGGGELHQTAAMQTGAGTRYAAALRLLTNFMSYMVTTYNLATQRARNARTPAQLAALAFDMAILFAIPVAGKMMLDAWTKGGGDGEDDDDPLWEAYMREQVAFLLSPFVGISQVAGTVRGDDAYGYRGPAGLGVFAEATNAGKALAEADFDASFWRPANKVAGMVFHYPASQIDASIRGAAAYFNGETDNPAAFLVGPPPSN